MGTRRRAVPKLLSPDSVGLVPRCPGADLDRLMLFLVLLSILSVLPSPAAADDCSDYGASQRTFTYGESTYSNWQNARDYCKAWHPAADLPVVHSWSDMVIVWNLIQYTNFWMGLTDAFGEGTWRWVDGSTVDFTNWRYDQPNNCCGGQDCAEVYWQTDLRWNDENCGSTNRRTFCQFYLDDIDLTEPSNPISNVKCGQNNCWCDWNVDTCPDPYGYCFGVHHLNSMVCDGGGNCDYNNDQSANGVCNCRTFWTNGPTGSCVCDERHMGADCSSDVECGGIVWYDGGVCGGHGECYNRADSGGGIVCECDNNWDDNGGVCNDFKCVDGNWALGGTSECSGRGTCTAFNSACVCNVPADYGGSTCQFPICWGVRADQSPCSGHGTCVAPNNCNCNNNWDDRLDHCDDYKCEDSVWALAGTSECNGHGTCSAFSSACGCFDNWADNGGICNDFKCQDGIWESTGLQCSTHGTCTSASSVCGCYNNWANNGGFCNDYKCQDGIWASGTSECSGHGTCTASVSTCNCVDNWENRAGYCDDYKCEDNLWDLTGASCSGNGHCAPDNPLCLCDSLWLDRLGQCDDYKCEDSVWALAGTSECNGHGTCSPSSTACGCFDNWADNGGICNDFKCEDGIWESTGLQCSTHGTCTSASSVCGCYNNWANNGGLCNDYKCQDGNWALPGTSECSGHGTCTPSVSTCNCVDNWENRAGYCDDYKCEDNLWDLTGASCSGNGHCAPDSPLCLCDSLWLDRLGQCDDYKCEDSVWALAGTSECSSHGTCSSTDATCVCDNNWDDQGFDYCNDYKCEDNRWILAQSGTVCSGHGSCSDTNRVCQCIQNYDDRADYCDDYQCIDGSWKIFSAGSECSGHGTCTSTNPNCVCDPGYAGTECPYAICDGLWSNHGDICNRAGDCVAPNNCNCLNEDRYRGTFCEIPVCTHYPSGDPRTCNGNGTCHGGLGIEPYCVCNEHHYGDDCEFDYICYDHYWYEEDACTTQTRGDCRDTDENCVCYEGYSGNECEYYVCNDIHGYEDHVCSGHGDCVEVDDCACIDTWKGDWCQYKSRCGNYDFDNYLVCRTRGECRLDTCNCMPGYTGADCEITVCFGHASDSDYVCGGQPRVVAGLCWDIDSCMCLSKFYGRECTEHFPDSTVYLGGLTTDPAYSFFVSYIPRGLAIPDVELPIGIQFGCGERLLWGESLKTVGEDALCSWRNDSRVGITVDISKTAPIVSMERAELEFALLDGLVVGMGAWIDVRVEIEKPTTVISEVGFFTPGVAAIFVLVVLFIICMALVIVGVVIGIFLYGRKQNVMAQEALLEKMSTMDGLAEDFAKDKAKLELAIRLQALKSEKPQHLPDAFVQLTGLDDENKVVVLRPAGQCSVWRRASLTDTVFMGHKVIGRSLDDRLKAVDRSCVNRLVSRAAKWASVPPHPHLRRFHAFYVEGQDIGVVKAEASGPRLLQTWAQEYDLAREATELAPDHAILIERLEGAQSVVEYMRRKRREAVTALPAGVLIRTAVLIEEKVKWLAQIVDAYSHIVNNGVVLTDFTLRSVLLVTEDRDVKLDMPFLNREPLNSRFVAPEVVLDVLKRKHPEIGPDKWSLFARAGHVLYSRGNDQAVWLSSQGKKEHRR